MQDSRDVDSGPDFDENGADLNIIRANLRLRPEERIRQHELRRQQAEANKVEVAANPAARTRAAPTLDPELDYRFMLTQDELACLIRYLRRSSFGQRAIAWCAVVLLVIAIGYLGTAMLFEAHDSTDVLIACGVLLVAFLIPVALTFTPGLSAKMEARSQMRNYHDLAREIHLTVNATGVRTSASTSEAAWKWDAVFAVERHKDLIFIMIGRKAALILPERVIREAGDSSEKVLAQLRAWRGGAPAFVPNCPQCGFDLRGGKIDGCPECGWRRLH